MADRLSAALAAAAPEMGRIGLDTLGTQVATRWDMRARLLLHGVLLAVGIAGVAVAADVLTVSDEEAVGGLVEALRDDASEGVLDWTDPAQRPVSLQVDGRVSRYDDVDALARAMGGVFDVFHGEYEVVQRSVAVDGDRADVAVRTRSPDGLSDTRFRLVRQGDRWLVTRIVAS